MITYKSIALTSGLNNFFMLRLALSLICSKMLSKNEPRVLMKKVHAPFCAARPSIGHYALQLFKPNILFSTILND